MMQTVKDNTSTRLSFDSDRDVWLWIVNYCRTNDYKMKVKQPLCLKIYNQLRNIISPKVLSSRDLYRGIGYHVNSIPYLKMIIPKRKRWNLWGRPDGYVTQAECRKAKNTLMLLHKVSADGAPKKPKEKSVNTLSLNRGRIKR